MDKGMWGWAAGAVDTFQKIFASNAGALYTHIESMAPALALPRVFDEQIFAGTATGAINETVSEDLKNYLLWEFIVNGADATNTIVIEVRIASGVWIELPLVDLATEAALVTPIVTSTVARFGIAGNLGPILTIITGIKVTKGGAGSSAVTVDVVGR